ncbi:hypothetical protein L3Q82_011343, partial [Scortum barcoo]
PEHRPAHLQLPLPACPLTTINTSTISGALTLIPPPSPPPSLQCSSPPPPPSPNLFTPTVDQVRTQLKKIKARKATGPDGISSRLLRDCADQLFPKTSRPKDLQPLQTRGLNVSPDEGTGEDRPQAPPPPGEPKHGSPAVCIPTQALGWMMPSSTYCRDPCLTSEDAGNAVRITFFDFSSAFNTDPPLTAQGEAGESGGQ